MTRSLPKFPAFGPVATLGVLALASTAHAQACPTTNVVVVEGSSAVQPFIKLIAKELAGLSSPITVLEESPGSCVGLGDLTSGTQMIGTATTWDSAGTQSTCDASAGYDINIGVSDVYPTTCGIDLSTVTPTMQDFYGPVQSMNIAVPAASVNVSISAEAAHLVFAEGASGAVPNYNDDTKIWCRGTGSGTQQMTAKAIGLDAGLWFGNGTAQQVGGGTMLTNLTAGDDHTIGILSSDVIMANPTAVKGLAFKAFGATCGYWPDSTSTGKDKQNTRDGHYPIWGPVHMVTTVSGGVPTDANTQTVLDMLTGVTPPTTFDLIATEAQGGVVPDCAMKVSRTAEVGPLASYEPASGVCECKFVAAATGTAPAGCQTCNASSDCAGKTRDGMATTVCNYGYCENR